MLPVSDCLSEESGRRQFLSMAGKGVGLAVPAVAALLEDLHGAVRSVGHLDAEQAAQDEDFWCQIQSLFRYRRQANDHTA